MYFDITKLKYERCKTFTFNKCNNVTNHFDISQLGLRTVNGSSASILGAVNMSGPRAPHSFIGVLCVFSIVVGQSEGCHWSVW